MVGWRPIEPNVSRLSRVCAATGFLLLLAITPAAAQSAERAAAPAESRGVLMINAYNLGYEWTDELIRGLRTGLEAHGGPPIDLWIEFLDTRRRGESLYSQVRSVVAANYGDDNARTLLATMAAAASLNTDTWDAPMLKALFANLRTTGRFGFRGDRIDMGPLERRGWKSY